MSKDRKDIYMGDGIRRAIDGMPGTLSTNVNVIADRYMAIVDRTRPALLPEQTRVLLLALREGRGHRLEGREIATFPALVKDWIQRHPSKLDVVNELDSRLAAMEFAELVGLVDWLERQQ